MGRLEVTLERASLTPEQICDKPQIQAGPFVILTVKDTVEETPLPTGNERILFIDDEEAITSVGRSLLTNLGYTVTAETKSPKALQIFQEAPDAYNMGIKRFITKPLSRKKLAESIRQVLDENS